MLARLSAFVIWALVAATAVFWGLRLFVHAPVVPPYAVAVGGATVARGDLTRLLGATPVDAPLVAAAPQAASRFRLLGIVAPRHAVADGSGPSGGVALIAVDGKMPRAYPVGARVDGDLVLQSVSLRTASIATGAGAAITLELPMPVAAATGSLPGAMSGAPMNALPTAPAPTTLQIPQFQPIAPQLVPPRQSAPQAIGASPVLPARPEPGAAVR